MRNRELHPRTAVHNDASVDTVIRGLQAASRNLA